MKDGSEFYDSGTDRYYTMFGEDLFVLDQEEDEWNPLDFEDIDDYITLLHYTKIISAFKETCTPIS